MLAPSCIIEVRRMRQQVRVRLAPRRGPKDDATRVRNRPAKQQMHTAAGSPEGNEGRRNRYAQPAGSAERSRLRQSKSTKRTGSAALGLRNVVSEPVRSVTARDQGSGRPLNEAGYSAHGFSHAVRTCFPP